MDFISLLILKILILAIVGYIGISPFIREWKQNSFEFTEWTIEVGEDIGVSIGCLVIFLFLIAVMF